MDELDAQDRHAAFMVGAIDTGPATPPSPVLVQELPLPEGVAPHMAFTQPGGNAPGESPGATGAAATAALAESIAVSAVAPATSSPSPAWNRPTEQGTELLEPRPVPSSIASAATVAPAAPIVCEDPGLGAPVLLIERAAPAPLLLVATPGAPDGGPVTATEILDFGPRDVPPRVTPQPPGDEPPPRPCPEGTMRKCCCCCCDEEAPAEEGTTGHVRILPIDPIPAREPVAGAESADACGCAAESGSCSCDEEESSPCGCAGDPAEPPPSVPDLPPAPTRRTGSPETGTDEPMVAADGPVGEIAEFTRRPWGPALDVPAVPTCPNGGTYGLHQHPDGGWYEGCPYDPENVSGSTPHFEGRNPDASCPPGLGPKATYTDPYSGERYYGCKLDPRQEPVLPGHIPGVGGAGGGFAAMPDLSRPAGAPAPAAQAQIMSGSGAPLLLASPSYPQLGVPADWRPRVPGAQVDVGSGGAELDLGATDPVPAMAPLEDDAPSGNCGCPSGQVRKRVCCCCTDNGHESAMDAAAAPPPLNLGLEDGIVLNDYPSCGCDREQALACRCAAKPKAPCSACCAKGASPPPADLPPATTRPRRLESPATAPGIGEPEAALSDGPAGEIAEFSRRPWGAGGMSWAEIYGTNEQGGPLRWWEPQWPNLCSNGTERGWFRDIYPPFREYYGCQYDARQSPIVPTGYQVGADRSPAAQPDESLTDPYWLPLLPNDPDCIKDMSRLAPPPTRDLPGAPDFAYVITSSLSPTLITTPPIPPAPCGYKYSGNYFAKDSLWWYQYISLEAAAGRGTVGWTLPLVPPPNSSWPGAPAYAYQSVINSSRRDNPSPNAPPAASGFVPTTNVFTKMTAHPGQPSSPRTESWTYQYRLLMSNQYGLRLPNSPPRASSSGLQPPLEIVAQDQPVEPGANSVGTPKSGTIAATCPYFQQNGRFIVTFGECDNRAPPGRPSWMLQDTDPEYAKRGEFHEDDERFWEAHYGKPPATETPPGGSSYFAAYRQRLEFVAMLLANLQHKLNAPNSPFLELILNFFGATEDILETDVLINIDHYRSKYGWDMGFDPEEILSNKGGLHYSKDDSENLDLHRKLARVCAENIWNATRIDCFTMRYAPAPRMGHTRTTQFTMAHYTLGFEARVSVKSAGIDVTALQGPARFTMDLYPILTDLYKFENDRTALAGATLNQSDFRWLHYMSLARAFAIWGVGKDRQDTWRYRHADSALGSVVDTPTTRHMVPMIGSRYVGK